MKHQKQENYSFKMQFLQMKQGNWAIFDFEVQIFCK